MVLSACGRNAAEIGLGAVLVASPVWRSAALKLGIRTANDAMRSWHRKDDCVIVQLDLGEVTRGFPDWTQRRLLAD